MNFELRSTRADTARLAKAKMRELSRINSRGELPVRDVYETLKQRALILGIVFLIGVEDFLDLR